MSIRIDVDRDVIIVISFDDSKQIGDVEDRRLRSRLASHLSQSQAFLILELQSIVYYEVYSLSLSRHSIAHDHTNLRRIDIQGHS
jgi:hypothetical protein